MNRLRLSFNRFELHFDRDYGIDKRTGWSAVVDGCFACQFCRTPFGAIWKAFKHWKTSRAWQDD